jgi:hypothetical protein
MVTKKKKTERAGERHDQKERKINKKKKRIEATTTSCMATKAPEDTGSELKTHCRQKTTTTTTTLASLRRFNPTKIQTSRHPGPYIYILSVLPLGNVPAATEPSTK